MTKAKGDIKQQGTKGKIVRIEVLAKTGGKNNQKFCGLSKNITRIFDSLKDKDSL
jgi:hypothetical protein